MSESEVLDKVIKVFQDVTDTDKITEESLLLDDLMLSSVEVLTVISALEVEFGIKIPEKYLRRMVTIADVRDIVLEIIENNN